MNCKLNKQVVNGVIKCCKDNIPSIKHIDSYRIEYNCNNDLVVNFDKDRIAVIHCSLLNVSLWWYSPITKYSKSIPEIQQSYTAKGIRSIILLDYLMDTTVPKYLQKHENMSDDINDLDLFDSEGDTFYIYDATAADFEFFKFKDRFEVIEYSPILVSWNQTRHMPTDVILEEHCGYSTQELDNICDNCKAEIAARNGYFTYYSSLMYTLKLKK